MNFFISGLTPLTFLCASEIVKPGDTVNLVDFKNTWSNEDYNSDRDNLKFWEDLIADFYNIRIKRQATIRWYCPPKQIRTSKPKYLDKLDLHIDNYSYVSDNLFDLISAQGINRKLISIPEGASCFSNVNLGQKRFIKSGLSKIYRLILRKNIEKSHSYLLTDADGQIKKKLENQKNISFYDHQKLRKGITNLSKFLFDKFPELEEFSNCKFVHPLMDQHSRNELYEYLEKVSKKIESENIFIKPRSRDASDYSDIESRYNNFKILPKRYRPLPAEIFLNDKDQKYIGYYSTLMLFFQKDKRILIEPLSNNVKDLHLSSYKNLINFLVI